MRKITAIAIAAAFAAMMPVSQASAAPAANLGTALKGAQAVEGQVVQVHRRKHRYKRRHWRRSYGYYPYYNRRRHYYRPYYYRPYYGYGYGYRYHRRPGFSFHFGY